MEERRFKMKIETLNPQTQNETFVLYSEYEDRGMPAKHFWKWNGKNWTTTRVDFLINFLNEYHDCVKCDNRSEWLYQNEDSILIHEMYNCHTKKVKLPDWVVNLIGYYEKNGKYYIYSDYKTTQSGNIRNPSSAWSKSIYKHVKTHKYLKHYFMEFPAKLREAKLLALDKDFMKNMKIRKQRTPKKVRIAA
jgi:hypothetical protein